MQKNNYSAEKMTKNEISLNNYSSGSKNNSNLSAILLLFLILLVFVLIFLLFDSYEKNNSLTVELFEKENSFSTEKSTLLSNIASLEKQKLDLELELSLVSSSLESVDKQRNDLIQKYDSLKQEADETLKKIDNYLISMSDSMKWFTTNSTFDNSSQQKRMTQLLNSNCIKKNLDSCEIKTACLRLIGSKEFGTFSFTYKLDEITSNKTDYLQSLTQFFENKGGDCEDFSLLFKAQINYLINYCGKENIIIEAYTSTKNDNEYFVNYNNNWFLSKARAKKLSKENIFPTIVCGNMYDLRSEQINGHCVVAFSSRKINSAEDLAYLVGAELVEPQSGEYLGVIKSTNNFNSVFDDSVNQNYEDIFLISKENYSTVISKPSFIHTIITDNDLYHFSFASKEWEYFLLFEKILIQQKTSLSQIRNN